jgi:hypothetical protein
LKLTYATFAGLSVYTERCALDGSTAATFPVVDFDLAKRARCTQRAGERNRPFLNDVASELFKLSLASQEHFSRT